MKILECYPHYPHGGGSSYYFRGLSEQLATLHDVALLSPDVKSIQTQLKKYEWNIPYRVSTSYNIHWTSALKYQELTEDKLRRYQAYLDKYLEQAVVDFQPDIIHVHFMLPSLLAAVKAKLKHGIPIVVTSHGADVRHNETDTRLRKEIRSNVDLIDAVAGVSPDHCRWLKEIFPEFSKKIICLPGGVNLNEFVLKDKIMTDSSQLYVLGVGRLEARKGFEVLIRAAAQLPFRTIIIGDGWNKNELENMIIDNNITNVSLLPFIESRSRDVLVDYYRGALTVVVPSLSKDETLSFVGLEAMASGTVVIASRIGGLPYILNNGNNGILFTPGDSDELANCILELSHNSSLRNDLIRNSRDYIKRNFTWEIISERYIDLFMQICT